MAVYEPIETKGGREALLRECGGYRLVYWAEAGHWIVGRRVPSGGTYEWRRLLGYGLVAGDPVTLAEKLEEWLETHKWLEADIGS